MKALGALHEGSRALGHSRLAGLPQQQQPGSSRHHWCNEFEARIESCICWLLSQGPLPKRALGPGALTGPGSTTRRWLAMPVTGPGRLISAGGPGPWRLAAVSTKTRVGVGAYRSGTGCQQVIVWLSGTTLSRTSTCRLGRLAHSWDYNNGAEAPNEPRE